ncbi:hypothetical protein MAPG_09854, partial [Magnaporthiopsis poae ATCC 64411]|uniref:Uncharacterized protein n=1 Tax=Magnaporthiopsis poae (strain ATCC 64411 / 73-15) TaxID=644358 RepID=A0A0C4EB13_MAGP6
RSRQHTFTCLLAHSPTSAIEANRNDIGVWGDIRDDGAQTTPGRCPMVIPSTLFLYGGARTRSKAHTRSKRSERSSFTLQKDSCRQPCWQTLTRCDPSAPDYRISLHSESTTRHRRTRRWRLDITREENSLPRLPLLPACRYMSRPHLSLHFFPRFCRHVGIAAAAARFSTTATHTNSRLAALPRRSEVPAAAALGGFRVQ